MVAYATIFGVIASIVGVFIAFKRFRKEHESKIATKDDVKVIDNKMDAYIKSHKELHEKDDKRLDEMFNMVHFLYQTEINKRNGH